MPLDSYSGAEIRCRYVCSEQSLSCLFSFAGHTAPRARLCSAFCHWCDIVLLFWKKVPKKPRKCSRLWRPLAPSGFEEFWKKIGLKTARRNETETKQFRNSFHFVVWTVYNVEWHLKISIDVFYTFDTLSFFLEFISILWCQPIEH